MSRLARALAVGGAVFIGLGLGIETLPAQERMGEASLRIDPEVARAQAARLLELAAAAQVRAAAGALSAEGEARARQEVFAATPLPSLDELWAGIEPELADRKALGELLGHLPLPLRRAAVDLLHEELRRRPRRLPMTAEERAAAQERVGRQMSPGPGGTQAIGPGLVAARIGSPEAPHAVRTVGDSCTYSNIQAAVNAASDGDVLHVQGKTFTGADATVNVVGKSLSFFGGYNSDCTLHNAGRTVLDATGRADSVFELWGGALETAFIDFFEITGGEPEGDGSGGGGIEIDDAYEVDLRRTYVHGNSSTDGGGVHLSAAADLFVREESLIYDNEASGSGGGVYCDSGHVEVGGDSAVGFWFIVPFPNTAQGDGGGIYGSGCRVDLVASDGRTAALLSNTAVGNGGGAYLSNGAFYSAGDPASVSANSAVLGGGIYATAGVSAQLKDVVINGNTADQGAGIYANGVTTLTNLKTQAGPPCAQGKCAELSNNVATLDGGGQFVHDGAIAFLTNLIAEGNQAGGEGSLLYADGGSDANLESVLATGNQGGSAVHLADLAGAGPAATVSGSTFAGNTGQSATFEVAATATLSGEGLIVWGNAGSLVSGGGATTIDCSVLQSAQAGTGNLVADPDFKDAAGGNYHLLAASPAVDHCADGPLRDADYDSRPIDIRGTLTDYDAGADEGSFPNLIFYDGFGSGNTTAWSLVVP